MLAAVLARGETIIENAAEEPEVVDLCAFLEKMGARIYGAGTKVIRIEGVRTLHGAEHTVIPDRIEAGTFLLGGAITGGDVFVENARPDHLKSLLAKLREAGMEVVPFDGGIRVIATARPKPLHVKTLPYPGFPTDLQAPMMALLTLADGPSIIPKPSLRTGSAMSRRCGGWVPTSIWTDAVRSLRAAHDCIRPRSSHLICARLQRSCWPDCLRMGTPSFMGWSILTAATKGWKKN